MRIASPSAGSLSCCPARSCSPREGCGLHLLLDVKANVPYTLEDARKVAEEKLNSARLIKENYMATHSPIVDREVDDIMNDVLYNIMKKSFEIDVKKD